ncbi:MAG: rhodanese-like domain-containing protein [Gammaproteobacteria bacterium]|nr:rhodanese-like domain-containing protein [Gammaproteobacteria bacterium]
MLEQLNEFVINQWMLFAALIIILAMLVKSFVGLKGVVDINPAKAIQLINHEDAVVLDVRTEDEFKEGHVLNSMHIPVGLLENRIKEIEGHKSKPVIVNCRTGSRSVSACAVLRKQGFTSIYKLAGGVLAWKKANLPLSKS